MHVFFALKLVQGREFVIFAFKFFCVYLMSQLSILVTETRLVCVDI